MNSRFNPPRALSPVRCLERARDLFGNLESVVDGSRRFTYAEFADMAQRLAGLLVLAGLRPGEPVAFLSRNGYHLLAAYFGVPLAQGLLSPLNVRLSKPELAALLAHSGARFLFYQPEFSELAALLPVEYKICLEDGFPNSAGIPLLALDLDENSPASLFYTSGTTGEPKGAVHTHRALYLHALSTALTFHIDDSTVELHTVPLFHANGWGRPHAAALMGARQILLPRFVPAEVYRLIETERVTSFGLVPAMAQQLLAAAPGDVSSVREIHLGGSPVSASLIRSLESRFHCLCTAGYGMTETGPVSTTGRPKRGSPRRTHDAGWPVVGASVRVDESGEVLLSGDHLLQGYWGEAQPTSEWIETGDLGSLDDSGILSITGRKKDIIISGGENISAAELERALEEHPAVSECAVVAATHPEWGETPLAFVVTHTAVTEQELSEWLEQRLARFKIPKLWRFVPGPLPRTATGKLAKVILRNTFLQTD